MFMLYRQSWSRRDELLNITISSETVSIFQNDKIIKLYDKHNKHYYTIINDSKQYRKLHY